MAGKPRGKPKTSAKAPAKRAPRITQGDRAITEHSPLTNGVKALGEAMILPGSSLILDGEIKGATLHAAGGLLARALVGPIGWLAIASNSFSKSVSGKNIWEHFRGGEPE